MAQMRQVGLLCAGCQPWNVEVVAASQDRFAYCATLAIYIYQLDRHYNEFKLLSIMSEHKKTITAICWHPRNSDLFASASTDNVVIVWNVSQQKVVMSLKNIKSPASSLGWGLHEKECVSFVSGRGPLYLWNYKVQNGLSIHREAQNFMSDVCQFRWHHKKMGKLAFGHVDGSISLFCPGVRPQKHVLRPEMFEGSDEEDPVTALEWDPLSTEYLLVVNTHSGIRLLDSDSLSVIMNFQLPSAAAQVHTLAWINSAPGMFVTGDTHVGVMRLFSVSKSTPIENIRLKKTGFHAMTVFTTAPGSKQSTDSNDSHLENSLTAVSSTSSSSSSHTCSSSSKFTLPPAHALCTFLDGGVGLYDLGRRKWDFLRDLGHVETIFDCKFSPNDANLLATASFDGTIKVWDVTTLEAVTSSAGNEGVIYCLSWAPADLNCIVAGTSKCGAFIWDISQGKVIKRFNEHGKSSVYSVAWNPKDSRRIASAGGDGFCCVRQVDGEMVMRYKHPGPVYGCDWNPHNKDMLATGCEDKNVRVFYLATNSEQPLKVFSGHSAKVFHVRWSPLREGILCSGSDDCTIRVWDYTAESCILTLQGHNGPVRGLLWSHEIPYLLFSGSWDYSIRIWDIRDGACLDTVLDHGADVYGLTCHPDRPFCLASCSRDSTVRIWSLSPLIQPLEIMIITSQPWDRSFANPELAYVPGGAPLLVGKASRDLQSEVEKLRGNQRAWILKHFSLFFASPEGTSNLWELVDVIEGTSEAMLSNRYKSGIIHMKHITKYKSAEAHEIEMIKVVRQMSSIGSPKHEDKLREAANIHIKLGNIQRYCELMVEVGEWEKALAVAPGVSMAYWKSLAERRAEQLLKEDNDFCVPYCVSTGKVRKLAKFFLSRGQLQDAFLTASAANEGSIRTPNIPTSLRSIPNGIGNDKEVDHFSLLVETSEELANWLFHNGKPILAACCHLAVDDCQKAMSKLLRGGELELAASVGLVLNNVKPLTDVALLFLARRCERIGYWDLAVDLLKMTDDPNLHLAQLCCRCAASMTEINSLHKKAGFPSMDECGSLASQFLSENKIEKAVLYYLMSTTPEIGLEIGLKEVKAKCSIRTWTADDVFPLLQIMASIQTEKLQQHKCSRFKDTLLGYCNYVGALVAVRRQYDVIVSSLLSHTLDLMKKSEVELPWSQSLISSELEAWNIKQKLLFNMNPSTPVKKDVTMTMEQQSLYDDFIRRTGNETWHVETGPDMLSGSGLPSHSDVHLSVITNERIQGPAFFLEDGRSAMSINEAVMWAKVNPFSPVNSGVRLNPF